MSTTDRLLVLAEDLLNRKVSAEDEKKIVKLLDELNVHATQEQESSSEEFFKLMITGWYVWTMFEKNNEKFKPKSD